MYMPQYCRLCSLDTLLWMPKAHRELQENFPSFRFCPFLKETALLAKKKGCWVWWNFIIGIYYRTGLYHTGFFLSKAPNKHSLICRGRKNIWGVYFFFFKYSLETCGIEEDLPDRTVLIHPGCSPWFQKHVHLPMLCPSPDELVVLMSLAVLGVPDLYGNFWSGTCSDSFVRGCGQGTHHLFLSPKILPGEKYCGAMERGCLPWKWIAESP